MAADKPSERDLLRAALEPGSECLATEALERCVEAGSTPPDLAAHLQACAHCRAELELLRSFLREASPEETAAVRAITNRLRLPEVRGGEAPLPWWKAWLQVRWLSPAAVAVAGMLIAVAVGLEWRHTGGPRLNVPNQPETEILRSGSIPIVAPVGDLADAPGRIQWQPAAGASRYEVRLLEVDHSELWKMSTSDSQVDIPPTARAKIVPAKTLLLQVTAFDGANRKLAESDFVRFRLLQKVYPH